MPLYCAFMFEVFKKYPNSNRPGLRVFYYGMDFQKILVSYWKIQSRNPIAVKWILKYLNLQIFIQTDRDEFEIDVETEDDFDVYLKSGIPRLFLGWAGGELILLVKRFSL